MIRQRFSQRRLAVRPSSVFPSRLFPLILLIDLVFFLLTAGMPFLPSTARGWSGWHKVSPHIRSLACLHADMERGRLGDQNRGHLHIKP